jgi:hypothetical protein
VSRFLTNLAARTLERTPLLRPLAGSRYEPGMQIVEDVSIEEEVSHRSRPSDGIEAPESIPTYANDKRDEREQRLRLSHVSDEPDLVTATLPRGALRQADQSNPPLYQQPPAKESDVPRSVERRLNAERLVQIVQSTGQADLGAVDDRSVRSSSSAQMASRFHDGVHSAVVASEPPVVHVHIGRIDVRAIPPAPAPVAPRVQHPRRPSLEEHLRARDEGKR